MPKRSAKKEKKNARQNKIQKNLNMPKTKSARSPRLVLITEEFLQSCSVDR